MDLRQLRYFVAAAEEKSFLLAARRVHISQPALSVRLKELEISLKTTLFKRHPRGVELTAAGEILLPHAREVLAAIVRADESMRAGKATTEPVKIWAAPTACLTLLPRLIEECGRAPDPLKLMVYERSIRGPNLLTEESLGAALSYAIQPSPEVQIFHLYHEDLYLVGLPAIVRDAENGTIAFTELSRHRLALYPKLMAIRQKIEDLAIHYDMRLNVVADVEPINAMKAMMLEASCCVIVPYPLFLREIRDGGLIAKRIASPQLSMTLKLAMHSSLPDAAADTLLAAVRSIVKRNIQSQEFKWRAIDFSETSNRNSTPAISSETVSARM